MKRTNLLYFLTLLLNTSVGVVWGAAIPTSVTATCGDELEEGTKVIDPKALCPPLPPVDLDPDPSPKIKCEGSRCGGNPPKIVAIRLTSLRGEGGKCAFVNVIPEKLLPKLCVPVNSSTNYPFLQILLLNKITSNKCVLTTQSYTILQNNSKSGCDISNGPHCTQIRTDCNFKAMEPMPLPSHSKKEDEVRPHPGSQGQGSTVLDKHEVVRRIRSRSTSWWRDHVMEIGLVSMIALFVVLIGLQACLAERCSNPFSHSRVVRFSIDSDKNKTVRRSSNSAASSSTACSSNLIPQPNNPHPRRDSQSVKVPSKPILKNYHPAANSNPVPKSSQENNSNNCRNSPQKQEKKKIQSFDSSSSIYYDAVEGDEETIQPLLQGQH